MRLRRFSFSFVGDSSEKASLSPRKRPLEIVAISWQGCVVFKFIAQNEPAGGLTISTRKQSAARPPESVRPRVRRPEAWRCTRRGTCTGVADERVKVGNFAVAEANSKKAIRMFFYSKRSCALLTLKNALRLPKKKNGELVRRFLWQEQTVSIWVAPARWKSNARHVERSLRSRFFFFFFFFLRTPRWTCVHFVGLAYMYAKNVR